MAEDPPDCSRVLDERDQPEPAATSRARQHVEPARLRAERCGEVSPQLGVHPEPSEGGKVRCISCAQSQFRPGRMDRVDSRTCADSAPSGSADAIMASEPSPGSTPTPGAGVAASLGRGNRDRQAACAASTP
jgi:hypothetical protein